MKAIPHNPATIVAIFDILGSGIAALRTAVISDPNAIFLQSEFEIYNSNEAQFRTNLVTPPEALSPTKLLALYISIDFSPI